MRVVFMGTPDFSVPTLQALREAGHDILAVYTQPPRPAGRGHKLRLSPVHRLAEEAHIPVFTPKSLKSSDEIEKFGAHAADVAVVVAYGLILPKAILEAPRHGCLNLHASRLPRWRGAAPIQRAIMAGDTETAVTVMRMDEGLDTGPICLEEPVAIPPQMTAGELHDELMVRGARLMVTALEKLGSDELSCHPQSENGVTYAKKIEKAETRIDWSQDATHVHNLIRGLSPYPGAWCDMPRENRRERVRVLRAQLAEGNGEPGEVLDDELTIACGTGAVRLIQLQRAGKRPVDAAAFLRGFSLPPGSRLP